MDAPFGLLRAIPVFLSIAALPPSDLDADPVSATFPSEEAMRWTIIALLLLAACGDASIPAAVIYPL
jgi:hypothetical protein